MATFNTPRCWSETSPGPKTPYACDYHRAHFCKKYGSQFPAICPTTTKKKSQNACESVHDCLKALDHFSYPSPYPPKYNGQNRYMNYAKPNPCLMYGELLSEMKNSSPRAGVPQLPQNFAKNSKPYGESVCGVCDDLNDRKSSKDCMDTSPSSKTTCRMDQPQFSFDLPFTVSLMDTSKRNPADEISPAVDYKSRVEKNRSMRPLKICPDLEKKDLVLAPNEPICVNATPIKWRRTKVTNGGENFEVCIPGPITIG